MTASVLIDTWWNVNNGGFGTSHTSDNILIDTWWNVNLSSLGNDNVVKSRFNRYMVECEYSYTITVPKNVIVLIDTWWNVNIMISGKRNMRN